MKTKQAIGLVLAVLGTLVAIGVSLYLTRDQNSLYGLFGTAAVASVMFNWRPDESNSAPIVVGVLVFFIGVLVALAVFLLKSEPALWGLLACVVVAAMGASNK